MGRPSRFEVVLRLVEGRGNLLPFPRQPLQGSGELVRPRDELLHPAAQIDQERDPCGKLCVALIELGGEGERRFHGRHVNVSRRG